MLTVKEAANYIKRPISAIYQMTHKRQIAFSKPSGGKLYIKRIDLDNYLSKGKTKSEDQLESDAITEIIFGKK